jgi:hypothetical protein
MSAVPCLIPEHAIEDWAKNEPEITTLSIDDLVKENAFPLPIARDLRSRKLGNVYLLIEIVSIIRALLSPAQFPVPIPDTFPA